jgi:putative lipoprotein (rSAM/lipoprotein system)
MKTRFYLSYNKVLAFLISILGFASACDDKEKKRYEYGMPSPYAGFIVRGSVSSEKDNSSIKNIEIIMEDSLFYYAKDTTYSDLNGNYVVKLGSSPMSEIFKIKLRDIDSTENGEYQNLDTIIKFEDHKFTGGDGLRFLGKTEKEFDLKMKPKEE